MSKHSMSGSEVSSKRFKSAELERSLPMKIPVLPAQSQVISLPLSLTNDDYTDRINYLLYNKMNLEKHLNLIDQLVRNDVTIK